MKTLLKRFEDLMVAVTFAQAGEYEEANRQLGVSEAAEKEEAAAINNAAAASARPAR